MRYKFFVLSVLMCLVSVSKDAYAQSDFELTQDNLQFPRERMELTDKQVLLFNGRGYVSPRQYGLTSFTNVYLFPVELYNYEFFINFFDETTQTLIRDDVGSEWHKWEHYQQGWDPLAGNFRAHAPKLIVTQDEVWKPNLYTRTGTFHKQFGDKWLSFALKSETCVSGEDNEVFVSVEIHNRDKVDLRMVLIPNQQAPNNMFCAGEQGSADTKVNTPFELASEQLRAVVTSDIAEKTEQGFRVTIPAKQKRKFNFSVRFITASKDNGKAPEGSISTRIKRAQDKTKDLLKWASEKVPMIKTENRLIGDFYNRCLLSVLMSRFDHDDFVIKPFWAVGIWPYTISWDNAFTSDVIAMLDPNSLKETLRINFEIGKMEKTYISWKGSALDMFYIAEPFSQQIMIQSYMNQTGDKSILSYPIGGPTLYEWLKRWAYELHDKYGRKDGLIDIGYSTETTIEIRTDGYSHIIPNINLLTVDFYKQLAEWGEWQNDKEASKFSQWADVLQKSIDEKLWNEEEGWYDNLYSDGSKAAVYTYQLFDVLGSPNLEKSKKLSLMSHIKDEVFLGKFGFYSFARTDTVHWDRIDCDWGGGGQYAGMPLRIARNLYKIGNSELGWEVLKRFAGYADYFPYITQNPSTDKPQQDLSAMPLQISAGAGVEAILFGTFGITPGIDGRISFNPVYNRELGICEMKGYKFRGHSYDLEMLRKTFKVYKDGKMLGEMKYGQGFTSAPPSPQ